MTQWSKILGSAGLLSAGLVAWWLTFFRLPDSTGGATPPTPQTAASEIALARTAHRAGPPLRPVPPNTSPAETPASAPKQDRLSARTLVGTKWERDGIRIEFGPDSRLLIGGRERAKWRVEGSRVRLFRDTTGEEHWLDIVDDKLMWEGQEISRVSG